LGKVWREEAGFKSVEVRQLLHDFMNNYFILS
jgi:hypothetical protein